ncbi:MAG: histone deacetylase [Candidatus Omnitrophota bacterium]|nr:histone deacetylase [Candidatus Omnitrophota bacterium]
MKTGLLYDERFLEHDAGQGHPECKERLTKALSFLEEQPWFSGLERIRAEEVDEKWIAMIHSAAYIRHAKESCEAGAPYLDSTDVGICSKSFEIAKLAAGGALNLADRVIRGNLRNGFALVRPPGHHAESEQALGFCLFNNIAIVARYLQKQHGIDKVLILDWDVHHGNGTQHVFEEDPSVLYISLHQYPFYPGTGGAFETGKGRGRGATLNCPMEAGASDGDYQAAFLDCIIPKIRDFRPEVVLISAGFDAHKEDPLGQVCLTTDCFRWMSERIAEVAAQYAGGRVISLLEGGYNLDVIGPSIAAHLGVLCGENERTSI